MELWIFSLTFILTIISFLIAVKTHRPVLFMLTGALLLAMGFMVMDSGITIFQGQEVIDLNATAKQIKPLKTQYTMDANPLLGMASWGFIGFGIILILLSLARTIRG